MDGAWFDRLVGKVGRRISSRRTVLRSLAGDAVGGAHARVRTEDAAAGCAKVTKSSGRVVCGGRCCQAGEVCADAELERGCRPVACPDRQNPENGDIGCGPSGSGCQCFVGFDGGVVCADTVSCAVCSTNTECAARFGADSACLGDSFCAGGTACTVPCPV
jgi:hypothetical protein